MAFWKEKKADFCVDQVTGRLIGRLKSRNWFLTSKKQERIVIQDRKHLKIQHLHQLKTRGIELDPRQRDCHSKIFQLISKNPHPNLLKIFGFNKKSVVVEFIESPLMLCAQGSPKYDRCKFYLDGFVDESTLTRFQTELTQAVEHLHHLGIFHGDLEPNNIVIDIHGRLRLIDFGFSLIATSQEMIDEERGKLEIILKRLENAKGKNV